MTPLASSAKILPILLIIALGMLLRYTRILAGDTIRDLKKLAVTITLPALLFLAFANLHAEVRYLGIIAIMFLACLGGLFFGRIIQPVTGIRASTFPMLFTGFEAGMLGYALYGSIYGLENLHWFALVDLGQVVFVFVVLIPALHRSTGKIPSYRTLFIEMLRTPVILAIMAGLLADQVGFLEVLSRSPLTAAIPQTLAMVGGMTTPLIAILIGFELHVSFRGMGRAALALGLRLLFWIPLGYAMAELVLHRWLHLGRWSMAALMLLVVLPPPFVIPIFLPPEKQQDLDFTVRLLALATFITLIAATLVALIFPV